MKGAGVERITEEEANGLTTAGFNTVEAFWSHCLKGFNNINQLEVKTGIKQKRLLKLLPDHVLNELLAGLVREEEGGFLTRTRWALRRNWQLLAMSACLLLLVLLGLRVKSYFYSAKPPLGFAGRVFVASRALKTGHVIQRGDFYGALLSPCQECFGSEVPVEGLILAQPVQEQKPLRYESVLRMQVVAKKDIEPNTAVTADAVGLAWSPYHPDAALQVACVINGKFKQGVRGGNVILKTLMTVGPALPDCDVPAH